MTFVSGNVLTAAQLNTYLSGNLQYLFDRVDVQSGEASGTSLSGTSFTNGPSVAFAAGTWLFFFTCQVDSNNLDNMEFRIRNSTDSTNIGAGTFTAVEQGTTGGNHVQAQVLGRATLASTKTIIGQARNQESGGGSIVGSNLVGIRIAP